MNAKSSTFFDDLKARLNNLELEQRKQTSALNQLGDLEAEVMRLEARLKHVDGEVYTDDSQAIDFDNMRDLDEITRLERELQNIDDKELKDFNEKRYFDEISELRSELGIVTKDLKKAAPMAKTAPTKAKQSKTAPTKTVTKANIDTPPAKKQPDVTATASKPLNKDKKVPEQVTAKKGYVVCLMFNPRSPTEWSEASGGGWRERGQGQCYPTVEYAQAALNKLKKQWPRHPFKIIKRN